ncbi:MAG: carboxypeptidase regulatory-like domain-containing protein [Planctomycetaceae bacterium]
MSAQYRLLATSLMALFGMCGGLAVAEEPASCDFTVVVAKHVLLLEGREIVTWDDIEQKIRSYPNGPKNTVHFYFTSAARSTGKAEEIKQQIWKLSKERILYGHSEGSLWPRSDVGYDRIEKPDDLRRNEEHRIGGTVLNRDEQPVEGAEVIVIGPVDPSIDYRSYHIALVEGHVRNRLEHDWTLSGDGGAFSVYPQPDKSFYVLALHREHGFAFVTEEHFQEHHTVRLLPWASLKTKFTDEERITDEVNLTLTIPEDQGRPEVVFDQYWSDLVTAATRRNQEEPIPGILHVPPLRKIVVSRSIKMEEGGSIGIPQDSAELFPGELRELELGPLNEEEQQRVNLMKAFINQRRRPLKLLKPVEVKKEQKAGGQEKKEAEPDDASTCDDTNEAIAEDSQTATTLEIRVVDMEGNIVKNANVEVRNRTEVSKENLKRGSFMKKQTYGTFFQTDEEGVLQFVFDEALERLTFSVITPGFGPYWAQWDAFPPSEFTAVLEPAWTVGGVVVDEAGTPVANATVHPSIEYRKRPGNDFQLGMGRSVKTDENGVWKFESVPNSKQSVNVTISHQDFAPQRLSLAGGTFAVRESMEPQQQIVMSKGLILKGTVTEAGTGKPVAGAVVLTEFSNQERKATTNDEGQYELIGCQTGRARLVVHANGKALTFRDLQIEEQPTPENFELQPGGHVRIRVVDPEGNPLPKTRIFFQSLGTERIRYFEFDHVDQYANDEGIWEWNEAPVEGFEADVCPPGKMQLPHVPFQPRDEEYVVTSLPDLILEGTVTDKATGKPIPEFRVIPGVVYNGGQVSIDRRGAVSARDGKFSVRPSRAYDGHLVRIEADGYQAKLSEQVASNAGAVTLDIQLEEAIDVFAKILTPNGLPAEGAKAALGINGSHISLQNGQIEESNSSSQRTVADEDGRIRFPAPGEEYILAVTHKEGYVFLRSEDMQTPKIIVLKAWSPLEGTYRIGDKPVGGVLVCLDVPSILNNIRGGPSIYASYQTTTDADGHYSFPMAIEGRAQIYRRILLLVNEGAQEVVSTPVVPVELEAGKSTTLDLGGTGRPLVGKLQQPATDAEPVPWRFAFIYLDQAGQGIENRRRYWATVEKDGTFRIDDVIPGSYSFQVRFDEHPIQFKPQLVEVPEGDESEPVDIGIIK